MCVRSTFRRRRNASALLTAALVLAALSSPSATAQTAPRTASAPGRARPAGAAITLPPVLLTAGHARLCKVAVGDAFPAVELPQLGGGPAKLESLAGAKATVILYWSPNSWMSRVALADMAQLAPSIEPKGAKVVGIAVGADDRRISAEIEKAGAKFPQLRDAEGKALSLVGTGAPPRIYVLDAKRQIVWFDIEYSEATRRELRQTLAALGVEG
jgi:peroxiredoxin